MLVGFSGRHFDSEKRVKIFVWDENLDDSELAVIGCSIYISTFQ